MGVFESSIIVHKLNDLVLLNMVEHVLLNLYEVIKRLELFGHMVYCVVDDLVYLHKFMVAAEASHLWICICMFLKTIITEWKLMSLAVLSNFLVVGSADGERNVRGHNLHMAKSP